jgi:hypothetical protein
MSNVRDPIEVGDTVLLGSRQIRATVTYYNPKCPGSIRAQIDGIDGMDSMGFRVSDVVEVIKPPKPMPEFQEGDRVCFQGSDVLYRVINVHPTYEYTREIWRLTAPDTLTKIWERKP